jgi:2'-5' RNA ligase
MEAATVEIVAKQRLKSPRARLFVALDLPDEIRDGIVAWQRAELGDSALRPMRPEQLHVTLAFLGYHPEKRIERIAEAALV